MDEIHSEHLNVDEKCFIPITEDIDTPFFRACDVQQAAGLTYRQLNNWDSIGVLPNSRGTELGWRQFSYREVFALAVCSDIRSRFGVSLQSLKSLQSYLLCEDINFLGEVRERMSADPLAFYLLTDLRDQFLLLSDVEVASPAIHKLLRGDNAVAFILHKLNPIVNRILLCLDTRARNRTSSEAYAVMDANQGKANIYTDQEKEVLRLVRAGAFDKISIQVKNGNIVSIEGEKAFLKSQLKSLLDILNNRAYQTVTVTKQHGEIIHIRQKMPIKLPQRIGSEPHTDRTTTDGRGKA